jgi:hypothetical protein
MTGDVPDHAEIPACFMMPIGSMPKRSRVSQHLLNELHSATIANNRTIARQSVHKA